MSAPPAPLPPLDDSQSTFSITSSSLHEPPSIPAPNQPPLEPSSLTQSSITQNPTHVQLQPAQEALDHIPIESPYTADAAAAAAASLPDLHGDPPPLIPRASYEPSEPQLRFSSEDSPQDASQISLQPMNRTRAVAMVNANPAVRVARKMGHDVVNKFEDLGIGILGVTDVVAQAGEGVGRTAVSGVGAVGNVVETGVVSAFAAPKGVKRILPREVDTDTQVDISGTVLKDLNRAIEVERMRGTSNTESPLNTPWILLIFPIIPIAFMYTKTILGIAFPPFLNAVLHVWSLFGWRFWMCLVLCIGLVLLIAWESIKAIGPLRPITMQVDVAAIKLRKSIHSQVDKQMPKVYKALDRILPLFRSALVLVDRLLTPKLGYSPLLAINARLNGWIYDPNIQRVTIGKPDIPDVDSEGYPVKGKVDRGQVMVMDEDRNVTHEGSGLEFDADQVSEQMARQSSIGEELFEQFFNVEICLRELSQLHRSYTSVWIEWTYRGMVVDRSVIRDISTSPQWEGCGTSFDDYTLSGEVRLPLRADTTTTKGGFFDVPIRLILKGRDGLPLYSNDGARRYMRDSPAVTIIGEIELSSLRMGIGTDPEGIIRSELCIPLHARGISQYRAAVLRASARITPVDSSSYSYRQMLSPLPNGEWTVSINVFELRNLRGVDESGSSDPYVSATVMGITKHTDRQRQTLSCMVNQLLFFSKLSTGLEIEEERIVIEVMDWNRFGAPQKIGLYTLDARRILELPGRELYRKWFALRDPSGGKRPAGFVKMSITVVPPGGSAPQHTAAEDTEEFSTAKLLKNTVLRTPTMKYQNWAVHITVGWADMLPRMASDRYRDAIRGYMKFSYSGWEECKSNVFIAEAKAVADPNIGSSCIVLPQRRVIWNEEYILPLTVINERVAQEGINLKLFHRTMPRLQAPMRGDQLIGQVNVSFEELFKNMTTAVVRGQAADGEDDGDRVRNVAMMKPRYYNFYGMSDGPADPYDKGVAFRGRVLIGVAAKPGDVPSPYLRPCPPPPRPKLEFYKMDFTVLRATELPLPDGWSVYVEGRIGLYQFKRQVLSDVIVHNFCAEWDENCSLTIPNMQFPEDVEQIPDFFVTIWARKPSTVVELEERMAAESNEGYSPKTASPSKGAAADGVDEADGEVVDDGTPKSPQNGAPLPDVNVEGGNGDALWQPKAFVRLPAKHLICGQQEPRWMFMDYPGNNVLDSGDNKVPGSILLSASLSRYDPANPVAEEDSYASPLGVMEKHLPVEEDSVSQLDIHDSDAITEATPSVMEGTMTPVRGVSATDTMGGASALASKPSSYSPNLGQERSYTLRALVLQGRNLPAADESGLSDPRVVVSMGDRSVMGSIFCKQTVSPLWEELIEVPDIKIRDGERKPNVNVLIFDYDGEGEPMQYLGRSIIPSAELDTADPSLEFSKWYPVFSVNPGVVVGEVLADFQLIPTDMAIEHPMSGPPSPPRSESALRISLVGLRDVKFLQYAAGDLFMESSVSGDSVKPVRSKRGAILQQRAYEANCNILDVLVMEIQIPEDLRLAPALNMYVYAMYNHSQGADMVATACIPLEKWLSEHHRRLLTGESLIDDSFGMDAPVPQRLFDSEYNYQFKRSAIKAGEEPIGAASLRLHEVKSQERGERKNMALLKEKQDVLRVGFPEDKKPKKIVAEKGFSVAEKLHKMFAPIRSVKYQIADTLADIMPDVSMALGIEVDEDIPLSSLMGMDDDKIDYDGTQNLKRERGFCPMELEVDFSEPAYGEFLLFRGDNRALGNTVGSMGNDDAGNSHNQAFPPILPFNEAPSTNTLVKREKRRAALEGARPTVGKIKARLDFIEVDKKEDVDLKTVRQASLRSFGRVFVPTEVVVRVYVLRGIHLQQIGSQCNPYLTTRFYGGYPDVYSQKHEPVLDDDNPNFFEVFESRVKMPGGSVRIEVKDRILPEINVPLAYPMYIKEEGQRKFGIVQQDVPVNVGKLGLGWSETIGETVIDLDARWYNSAWRSLAKTPVETRALYSEESANLKGKLEMFVDIFDAKDVDKRPKVFRPVPISAPPQEKYELRVVVYKLSECMLPYKLADYKPTKVAAFYVMARLGNRPQDEKKTDRCRHVADGVAEFNWRMKWEVNLPSLEVKPRLKLQIFDDTTHGLGDDQLCAVADIKLRSLFDEIMVNKKPMIKKKQWILMSHPNYPEVSTRLQVSLELTTAELAAKKRCLAGNDGYKEDQHEDYILARPFQPAAFSVYNPVPYFYYLVVSTLLNLQWQLATVMLVFPFMPMIVQFVFMVTPWQWYAMGGTCGLVIFIRLMMVSAARTARTQAEKNGVSNIES